MKVFRRSLYAWVALLGIVFSQLAVSAYACPGLNALNPSKNTAKVMAENEMAGMPCAGMGMADADMEQPALCLQHCDWGSQTGAFKSVGRYFKRPCHSSSDPIGDWRGLSEG